MATSSVADFQTLGYALNIPGTVNFGQGSKIIVNKGNVNAKDAVGVADVQCLGGATLYLAGKPFNFPVLSQIGKVNRGLVLICQAIR